MLLRLLFGVRRREKNRVATRRSATSSCEREGFSSFLRETSPSTESSVLTSSPRKTDSLWRHGPNLFLSRLTFQFPLRLDGHHLFSSTEKQAAPRTAAILETPRMLCTRKRVKETKTTGRTDERKDRLTSFVFSPSFPSQVGGLLVDLPGPII